MKLGLLILGSVLLLISNTSYAVTLPANIMAYMPITLTNNQNAAIAANTPLPIGSFSYAGNILGFNAIAYQQYETCNLDNGEFFFVNGTVINSWLEGNVFNEDAANDLCTSYSSTNALAASSNVLYWVDYSWPSSFLSANTGTATTNTIYLGWTGDIISAANNLMSNTVAGEAPQLTCSNPSNTEICNIVTQNGITYSYGSFDNGNTVFGANGLYFNFAGTTMPSQLTVQGECTSTTSTAAVDNGVFFQNGGSNCQVLIDNAKTFNPPFAVDVLSGFPSPGQAGANSGAGFIPPGGFTDVWVTRIQGTGFDWLYYLDGAYTFTSVPAAANTLYVETMGGTSSQSISMENYDALAISSTAVPASDNPIFTDVDGGAASIIQWARLRLYPAGGLYPTTSFGPVQLPLIATLSSTPSSPISINAGQIVTFNAYSSGGTAPYTYNFIIYDYPTNAILSATLTSSNSLAWTVPASYAGYSVYANVIVTDSETTNEIVNSVSTGIFTIPAATTATTTAGCGEWCGSGGTGVYGTTPPTTSTTGTTTTVSTAVTSTAPTTTAQQSNITSGNQTICSQQDGANYTVNYTSIGSSFHVFSNSVSCFEITAINITRAGNVAVPPANQSALLIVNLTAPSNVSINATIAYPCDIPSSQVAPFILKNGTWNEINPFSVNAVQCTVTFAVPSDPVIAIFEFAASTAVSAVPSSPSQSSISWLPIIVVIVIVLLIIFFLFRRRKKSNKS